MSVAGAAALSGASTKLTIQSLGSGINTDTVTFNGSHMVAGPVNVSLNGGTSFQTYNADLSRSELFNNAKTVTIQNTAGMSANYQYAARLYNAFAVQVGTNPLDSAGLQVAIWEALYPGQSYSDYTSPGVAAQASQYLSENVSSYSDKADYYNFNGANAGQIGAYTTPEPTPVMALAFGLAALLRTHRQRRPRRLSS